MKITMNIQPQQSESYLLWTQEIECGWRASNSRLKESEWLALFPEVADIIPTKIEEWKDEIERLELSAQDFISEYCVRITDHLAKELITEWVIFETACKIITAKKHIARLSYTLPQAEQHNILSWESKIERARNATLIEFASAELHLTKRGANFVALCPFHNERTPSFTIFPKTNTFKCFGCQESGDVITYYMKSQDVEFTEAVQELSGRQA